MKKTILITLILLTFCISIFAQEDNNIIAGTASSIENRPADEGKILGGTPKYDIRGNNLGYLESLQRPDLKIVFNSSQKSDMESSKKIVKILDSHWEDAIKFYYNYQVKKFPDAQTQIDEMLRWTSDSNKNSDKLQKISIDAPNGERNISKNEADEMLGFLNKTAMEIMEKAKDAKGEYKAIKIKSKPSVSIGNCSQNNGIVTLSVTFDKSAKVTDVEIQSFSGCSDFDENAIKAAKGIKFSPATVAGEPITLTKKVQYSFSMF